MKACLIQPPYSRDTSYSDEYFAYKMRMLDECDASVDIIVLPEYSDVPCATSTKEEMIGKAHEHGIKCNVFWSDDPKETREFLDMGIDTILTNDYNLISQCVER